MDTVSIALVIHGNAFLSGRPPSPFPLEAIATKGSTFAFSVAEKNSNGEIMEQQVASTPEEWFAYLAQAQARGLQFYYAGGADDLRRVWMASGVSSAIEVLLPQNITELWVASVHTVGPPQPVSAQKGWLRGKVFPMLLSWNDTSLPRSRAWKIFLEPPILVLLWPYNLYLLVRLLVDFVIPRRRLPSEWHWHWTYQRTWSGIALSSAPTELDASAAELAESLDLAQAFALRHDLADFCARHSARTSGTRQSKP